MKLSEVKRTITGTNSLHCLVSLEYTCGNVYFVDNTKGICKRITNQRQLNQVLSENKF